MTGKRLEEIRFMKAEDLPDKIKAEHGIFSGFVEIRLESGSPIRPTITPLLKETPAERLFKFIEKEDLQGTIFSL